MSVLVELTRMDGTKHGQLIANQMLDVAIRVQAVRAFTVSQMVRTTCDVILCKQHETIYCDLMCACRRWYWRTPTLLLAARNETVFVRCSTQLHGFVANFHSKLYKFHDV